MELSKLRNRDRKQQNKEYKEKREPFSKECQNRKPKSI